MKNMSAVIDVLLKSKAKADCVNKVLLQCKNKPFTAIHTAIHTRDRGGGGGGGDTV